MNSQKSILISGQHDQIANIALNRAEQRNPLDKDTVMDLLAAIRQLERRPEVRIVILRGSGGNFSAGGDLRGYQDLYQRPEAFRSFLTDFHDMLEAIEQSRKIYIAAIEGFCVAGGLELLLACDIVVAAESAKIGDGHVKFGQLPGAGGSQRLPRTIGPMRARQLMLTGDLISAREAERIGLISSVLADAEFDQGVEQLAQRLCLVSPLGLAGIKQLTYIALNHDLGRGLREELDFVHNYATTSQDAMEGLKAFEEKRKPHFVGR